MTFDEVKEKFQAEPKASGIDKFLEDLMGKSRPETIHGGECMMCDSPNLDFRDLTSRKEYTISGMCQNCQDSFFGGNI